MSKKTDCDKKAAKKTSIGGQALIEGIMMKGPKKTVMAIRQADGKIKVVPVDEEEKRGIVYKIPLVRGVVAMVESLILGSRCLMDSAEISLQSEDDGETEIVEAAEEAADEAAENGGEVGNTESAESADEPLPQETAQASGALQAEEQERAAAANDKTEDKKKRLEIPMTDAVMNVVMGIAMVLGVGIAILLFLYLPSLIFDGINYLVGGGIAGWRSVIEGVFKVAIFLAYLAGVSLMPDIKRVFKYHGAEHKTIFCYEAGLDLTVENVKKFKRFHPRCGTSFMFLMIIVSVVFSTFLVVFAPNLTSSRLVWVGIKLLVIPVVCGVGYELIKFCGRSDSLISRIIAAPGLWVQRLTTKEPEDGMIECAIAAIKEVIPENPEEDRW